MRNLDIDLTIPRHLNTLHFVRHGHLLGSCDPPIWSMLD